jgi:hypothetical protein
MVNGRFGYDMADLLFKNGQFKFSDKGVSDVGPSYVARYLLVDFLDGNRSGPAYGRNSFFVSEEAQSGIQYLTHLLLGHHGFVPLHFN